MKPFTVGLLFVLLDSTAPFYMLAAPGRLYRLRDESMPAFTHGRHGRSERTHRELHATDDPLWLADFNNQNMRPNELNGLALDFLFKNDRLPLSRTAHMGNQLRSPAQAILSNLYYGTE
uniref:Neuropeptide n=1 Tax=Ascaris lumbricoides TaxID=6252 RepID=A0A0M3HTY6_ASCLU